MSELKIDMNPVGQELVRQLRSVVPVRTGRLRNSIQYEVKEEQDGYVLSLIMEDYFKWLKDRRKPMTLPTRRELMMARPPLPKMNNLGVVKQADLSPRSKRIMDSLDIMEALSTLDKEVIENQIKDILTYD